MNGSTPVELNLRDIHLPSSELWWPLAPGWWILLCTVVLLIVLAFWFYRRFKQTSSRRAALVELQHIRSGQADLGDQQTVAAIAVLLRRVTLTYNGRRHAGRLGEAWIADLQQLVPGDSFSQQQLNHLIYDRFRPGAQCDVSALMMSAENWLKRLPVRDSHAAV